MLSQNGATTEGVFRIPAPSSDLQRLIKRFDEGLSSLPISFLPLSLSSLSFLSFFFLSLSACSLPSQSSHLLLFSKSIGRQFGYRLHLYGSPPAIRPLPRRRAQEAPARISRFVDPCVLVRPCDCARNARRTRQCAAEPRRNPPCREQARDDVCDKIFTRVLASRYSILILPPLPRLSILTISLQIVLHDRR